MVPLLAVAVGIGIFIMFLGLARTPQTNTAAMGQQRLQVYGGGEQRPLTMGELELQRAVTEPIVRLGTIMPRSTPQKARQDLQNRLDLAGRPGNLTPEDFAAVRLVAAAVLAAVGLLLGFLLANTLYLIFSLVAGALLGYFAPVLWLKQKVDARRTEV